MSSSLMMEFRLGDLLGKVDSLGCSGLAAGHASVPGGPRRRRSLPQRPTPGSSSAVGAPPGLTPRQQRRLSHPTPQGASSRQQGPAWPEPPAEARHSSICRPLLGLTLQAVGLLNGTLESRRRGKSTPRRSGGTDPIHFPSSSFLPEEVPSLEGREARPPDVSAGERRQVRKGRLWLP